jgi:hypothetical protein
MVAMVACTWGYKACTWEHGGTQGSMHMRIWGHGQEQLALAEICKDMGQWEHWICMQSMGACGIKGDIHNIHYSYILTLHHVYFLSQDLSYIQPKRN